MKKLFCLLVTSTFLGFITVDPLTQQEKDYAVKLLQSTEQGVEESIGNLTSAQLKYKPSEDQWSVEECLKHIAVSEQNLWLMVEGALKQPANPEKRTDIKVTDEQLIAGAEDRSNKRKTFEALEPENTPFQSAEDALLSFKENRDKLIAFINTSNADLRNHVLELPLGTFDTYQFILLIGAHSKRHTRQIEEVKALQSFPKS